MNLDDIQLPPGSYSSGMILHKQHSDEQQLLNQPYQGSPSLNQQYQNYPNAQQQQQQGYYQQGILNRNYYGQMQQGNKTYEQQPQGSQGNQNTYGNQPIYQGHQNYQEQFHISPGIGQQQQQQKQHLQQTQQLGGQQQQYQYTQTTSSNNNYSSLDISYQQQHPQLHQPSRESLPFYQQQQQHFSVHQEESIQNNNNHVFYRQPHHFQQQQQSLPNSLEHSGQQNIYEESHLPHYPQQQQQPQINLKLQQQQMSTTPQSQQQSVPHGSYSQHPYQQVPEQPQPYTHYYSSPNGHPLQQQIQFQEKQQFSREYLQGGSELNNNNTNYSPHHYHNYQHYIPNDHKQVVNNYPRTSSAQSPPFQQPLAQGQQQLLFQSAQTNLTQPIRLQQHQQATSMQDIKDEGGVLCQPISKTSVCIPLPQAYLRGSHSNEEAGRGHKYHHHITVGSASAEPSKKLSAKEQSELKLERKYKKASQTNSQIKKIQSSLKHKEESGQEGDSASTEANAFRKYLQKDRQGGLNSQIELNKEQQQTKQEQESEQESESIDGIKLQSQIGCRNNNNKKQKQQQKQININNTSHSHLSSAQSLDHCYGHDGGLDEQQQQQSEMIAESSASCMLAEEEGEDEEEDIKKNVNKQQQVSRKQQQINIDNQQDEICDEKVRIRSQSSHMHDGKGLKEEEDNNQKVEEIGNQDNNSLNKTKTPVDNSKTDEIAILADSIKHCNKKNVVKNIMSAFLTFMNDRHFKIYSEADQSCILSLYHSQQSGAATDEDDKIETIRQKFKRYIAPKSLNHYNVRLLILHPNYGPIFKYFIMNPIHKWINNSKVSDLGAHIKMIGFFLSCFQDPTILEELKRHEKKRAHFS